MADLGVLRAIRQEIDRPDPAQRQLPVISALEPLLGQRLRRGTLVAIDGTAARSSLAMALLAGVSIAGGWCGVVGLPSFGYAAAHRFGVRLEAVAAVPDPGHAWPEVVAALATGTDLVLVQPPTVVPGRLARQLAARARQANCTLLTFGPAWEGSDLRLSVRHCQWTGLGQGSGRLRGCRVSLTASHRPQAALELWLPDASGQVHHPSSADLHPMSPGRQADQASPRYAGARPYSVELGRKSG